MHNQEIIFDIDNSRLGIVQSDCSQGKKPKYNPIISSNTQMENEIEGLLINKSLLANAFWYKHNNSGSTFQSDDLSMRRYYPINIALCYYYNTLKNLRSIEVFLVACAIIFSLMSYALLVCSCFFRYRFNVLCCRYLGDLEGSVSIQQSHELSNIVPNEDVHGGIESA
jgi:hypothetical protein